MIMKKQQKIKSLVSVIIPTHNRKERFKPTENFKLIFNNTKKILIIGNYGDGNLGDEAILDVIIRELNHLEIKNIDVVSRNPKKVGELHNNSVKGISVIRFLKDFFFYDTITIGCGTIFSDHSGPFIYLAQLFIIIGKIFGKKIVFLNIGYASSTPIILKLLTSVSLRISDFMSVRDRKTLENIRKLGIKKHITISHDLTFKLAYKYKSTKIDFIYNKENIDKDKLKIGIALRGNLNKKIKIEIAKLIDWLTTEVNAEVIFFSFNLGFITTKSTDKRLGYEIKSLLKSKKGLNFLDYYPYRTVLTLIKKLNLLIGMPFHSLVFAYMMKTPVIGVSSEEKCHVFLGEIGEKCVDPSHLSFEKLKEEVIKKLNIRKI